MSAFSAHGTRPAAGVRAEDGTLTWSSPTEPELLDLLSRTESVTIVGVSARPDRPSHGVARHLIEHSPFRVHLVNPGLDELFGRPVYPTVGDVPGGPDLVSVFRRQSEIPNVAEQVIAAGARTLWLQLDLWDEPVAQRAHEAGLAVVMNRCIAIEYDRFAGQLRAH